MVFKALQTVIFVQEILNFVVEYIWSGLECISPWLVGWWCWFIGFLENSFRDQTPLHPTGSQPINNTTPSCNSNTRISPDKTIIFFTKPFESKVFLFFSWDTRSPYVCWVVVIDLNQTEALCNWEWETFGSRSFCKKEEEKNTFYICFTSEYILVGTLKVDRAGLFNNQNVYSGDLIPLSRGLRGGVRISKYIAICHNILGIFEISLEYLKIRRISKYIVGAASADPKKVNKDWPNPLFASSSLEENQYKDSYSSLFIIISFTS